MIDSKRGLIACGTITLLLGLIVMFPARVVSNWLLPPAIAVSGIQGTAWHGSVREIAIGGIYLRDLEWHLRPLQLFTGRLAYRIEAIPVSGLIRTNLEVGLNGSLFLSDLQAALPLELFAEASNIRGLQGNVRLDFDRVEIVAGLMTIADGSLDVTNLVVPAIGGTSLGGYRAEFSTQNNAITASIEDTDGVLELEGSLQVHADRSYEFIAKIAAKPETPQVIRQQLQYLPVVGNRGERELRLEGIL